MLRDMDGGFTWGALVRAVVGLMTVMLLCLPLGCFDFQGSSKKGSATVQSAGSVTAPASRQARNNDDTTVAPVEDHGPVSVDFEQNHDYFSISQDQVIIRSEADWHAFGKSSLAIIQLDPVTLQPVQPSGPCNFEDYMLVIFNLGSVSGCGPPKITVTDVFILDGSMMVQHQTETIVPNLVNPDKPEYGYITCFGIYPIILAVCVPQFDGPVESVGTYFPVYDIVLQ